MKLQSLVWLGLLTASLTTCVSPIANRPPGMVSPTISGHKPEPGPAVRLPLPLAIYYGWPSAVIFQRGSGTAVSEQFGQFAVVVLGAGLNHASHPDHLYAQSLIRDLRRHNVEVYGYIDAGVITQPRPVSFTELESEIDAWRGMDVTGIFLDDAGYEYAGPVSYADYRQRLAALVQSTHAAGLRVFLNAWNPDDLFQPTGSDGTPVPIPTLYDTDLVLAESWFVSNNRFVNPTTWYHRVEKLAAYRKQHTFRLACVATGSPPSGMLESSQLEAAYWAAVMYGCDFFQYTSPEYSAGALPHGNVLYVHNLPTTVPAPGDRYVGDVTLTQYQGVWHFTRPTQQGEVVVTSDGNHSGYGFFRRREASP